MTGAGNCSMKWSNFAPQYPSWPMPTLLSLSSCTPMLVGLAWGLFPTRSVMTGWMPSSPMPAEVWPRLKPITQSTNWSFLLLSGLWLKNSTSTSMGQPLMFIPTIIPWPTFKIQQSWMLQVTAGWPVLPIMTFNYISGWGGQHWCGCLVKGVLAHVCLTPWEHTPRSLQQQCEPCRRPLSRALWAPLRHTAVTCMSWTK